MRKLTRFILPLLFLLCASIAQAAQTNFAIPPDTNGRYASMVRLMPTYVDARVLAATTNESATVPTGARFVVFSANCPEFYVKSGGTAAIPAADVTDGSGSIMNPAALFIEGATSLGVIAPTVCTVTMEFYL